ncbi:MAG TPA: VWA domain-containing protein [Thermoanaerobaculia bacterium]|nr:VWA domain-containing protein [Thermoanaerobaculia bacterium]
MKLLRFLPALLLALPLLAQETPPLQPFNEAIDVKVVNVEVYVTDRDGRRVQGLGREDFELFEDGKRVEVVNFAEVGERAQSSQAPAPVPPAEGAAPEAVPAPPAPPVERDRLHLLVYVDNFNLTPYSRNRVLKQLRSFLEETVQADDRVLLVTHDEGLNVRVPFSAGKNAMLAELPKLEKLAARGALNDHHARQVRSFIQETGCDDELKRDQVLSAARSYAQTSYNNVAMSLNALQGLVESLSGIEGRKAILYVSNGLSFRPGEDVYMLVDAICGRQPSFSLVDVSTRLRELTATANAARVTFYSLEAAGLRSSTSASAETQFNSYTAEMDFMKNSDLQDVIYNLASETGGRAVLNATSIAPDLARIASDLRSYYSLGYTPAHSGDRRMHQLKVKVKRDGVQVHHRTTYRDSSREEILASRVQTVLLHGFEDNPLSAQLEFISSEPEKKGRHLVTLRLRIPFSKLVLLSQEGFWGGKLTLWVGTRDTAGRMAPVRSVEIPVRIPAPKGGEALSGAFVYDIRMTMAGKGEQTVAVGIRDDLGQTASFLAKALQVEKRGVTDAARPEPGR